jgi:hypothetical protein
VTASSSPFAASDPPLAIDGVSHRYGERLALDVVAVCTIAFLTGAVLAYDPARGFLVRRGGLGG